jgi:ATP phosphoribosyltransferase
VEDAIPSMESPTVLDLAEKGYKAIHSVVNEGDVYGIINELKKLGCKDILVLPIERLVE